MACNCGRKGGYVLTTASGKTMTYATEAEAAAAKARNPGSSYKPKA